MYYAVKLLKVQLTPSCPFHFPMLPSLKSSTPHHASGPNRSLNHKPTPVAQIYCPGRFPHAQSPPN